MSDCWDWDYFEDELLIADLTRMCDEVGDVDEHRGDLDPGD